MALLERHLLGFGRDAVAGFPVTVIEGARKVGKSTFASQLISDRSAVQVTLDDPSTLQAARDDPTAFVEQARTTLVIDEVQRHPELLVAIKASVDRDRRPGRFVLTGSSNLLRLERTPDSLAGRAVTLRLRGLSQGEMLGVHDDFVHSLETDDPMTATSTWHRKDYAEVIGVGGYPEMRALAPRLRRAWLDSYVERIVQRDIHDVRGPTSPERLRSVLRLIAANQSGELVKARVAQQAGIPPTSIDVYLDLLETVFLLERIPSFTPNLTRREIGRSKAIVADGGLATRLVGVTAEQMSVLTGSDHLGPFLEGFVVGELSKQQTWSAVDYELRHYRDRDGMEVDLVLERRDGGVYGVEVKASSTFKSEHFRGLKFMRDKLGDRFLGGYVLGTASDPIAFGRKLWGLPVSALWRGSARSSAD